VWRSSSGFSGGSGRRRGLGEKLIFGFRLIAERKNFHTIGYFLLTADKSYKHYSQHSGSEGFERYEDNRKIL